MRLIDVDRTMINFGFEWDDITPTADEFCDFLRRQPSVDAVPVIRCKDCTFGHYIDHGHMHCLHPCGLTTNMTDDFCSYAERKEKKNERMG